MSLSELRRVGEKIMETKKEKRILFCYMGTTQGQNGMGFLAKKKKPKKTLCIIEA